jgi:RecB family exonuclease
VRPFTQSELGTFRDCRRKWWLGTHRGLRLKPQYQRISAAWLGTLVHAALESRDQGQDWREVLRVHRDAAYEAMAEDPDRLKKNLEHHDMAEIMVEGYIQWLENTGADQFLETLAVEEKITVDFNDHQLMGKLDKLVRDKTSGDVFFIDYKTVGNLTDIPRQAATSEQFLHYALILSLLEPENETPMKGVWRMMKKSKRTDRTLKDDGTEQEFFAEHEYTFNSHQVRSYMVRLLGIIHDIQDVERKLNEGEDPLFVVYPRPTNDCYWKCEFFGICTMFDDGSRVEDFITDWYDERDPLERYQDITPTESESE